MQSYWQGKRPDTPEGIKDASFRKEVRRWVRLEDIHGPEILKHGPNISWTPDDKLKLVLKVLAGNSIKSVSIESVINNGQLYSWVNKYKDYGYNGLVNKNKGRKSNNTDIKNNTRYF